MDFTITKREVIASIIIVAILLIIGILLSTKISSSLDKKNEEYKTAIEIDDNKDLFEYGMRTDVGNAFVYGSLKVVDPVSFSDIDGEYYSIRKYKEHYTMHTKRVAHTRTVNGKTETYYTTETYWTWDKVSFSEKTIKCTTINFCGVDFSTSKINLSNQEYHNKTEYVGSDDRWVYYTIDTNFTGTIYTNLSDNTITDNSKFMNNLNTIQAQKELIKNNKGILILFWIIWILLIALAVYGFYYIDNDWLEDNFRSYKRGW